MARVVKGRFFKIFALLAFIIFSLENPLYALRKMTDANKSQFSSTMSVPNAAHLKNEFLVLDCPWDYFESELIEPVEFSFDQSNKGKLVTLPHIFADGVNYGSYHCRLEGLLPNTVYGMNIYGRILTSCKIWCNKQLVGGAGFLNKEKELSTPAQTSSIIELPSDENGAVDIIIHVANFELNKGGIIKLPVITEKSTLQQKYIRNFFFDAMIIAFFLMLIVYNLILIVLNNKPLVYFSLVAVCCLLILSVGATGISILNLIFPEVPFWIEYRISVFLFAIDVSAYIFYMAVSHRIYGRKFTILFMISVINELAAFFIPLKIFETYRAAFIIVPLALLFSTLIMSLGFLIKKNAKEKSSVDAVLYNFEMVVNVGILGAYFLDFLFMPRYVNLFHSYLLFKLAILFFGFMQCAIPAFRRFFTNYRIQKSSERFEQNNDLLAKFVPAQMLRIINANDVTKIVPNSCYSIDAMIVYVEICYFKQLSESVDSQELFEIMNIYYKEVAPVIQSYGGYISRYMYHGCLAIFSERNDSVMKCAFKMQEKMNDVKKLLRKNHSIDLSIGIAIHTGRVACGFIGSDKRLSPTAFSPEIKTAISIGMQTSRTNKRILISEDAMAYCRSYMDCMYEGHFILIDGKRILVYSAIPLKNIDVDYGEVLELVEEVEEVAEE